MNLSLTPASRAHKQRRGVEIPCSVVHLKDLRLVQRTSSRAADARQSAHQQRYDIYAYISLRGHPTDDVNADASGRGGWAHRRLSNGRKRDRRTAHRTRERERFYQQLTLSQCGDPQCKLLPKQRQERALLMSIRMLARFRVNCPVLWPPMELFRVYFCRSPRGIGRKQQQKLWRGGAVSFFH